MMKLSEMSAEQLLDEYASEVSVEDRRISTDPPDNQFALRAELLRRLLLGAPAQQGVTTSRKDEIAHVMMRKFHEHLQDCVGGCPYCHQIVHEYEVEVRALAAPPVSEGLPIITLSHGGTPALSEEEGEKAKELKDGKRAAPPVEPTIRSCNRHVDCDKAEEEMLARHPGKAKADISFTFHCHDEECEDCFGT